MGKSTEGWGVMSGFLPRRLYISYLCVSPLLLEKFLSEIRLYPLLPYRRPCKMMTFT